MKILALVVQFIAQSSRRLWPVGTWANRPAASSSIYGFYFVTDVGGGALFRSNGTRWVPVSACLTLAEQNTDVTVSGTTNRVVVSLISLPAGLLGPNDRIECWTNNTRSGTTNQTTFRLLLGGDATGTGSTVVTARAQTNATQITETILCGFANRNSLTTQLGFGAGGFGGSATAYQIAAVDTSAAQYCSYTLQQASAADSVTVNSASWRLIRGTA